MSSFFPNWDAQLYHFQTGTQGVECALDPQGASNEVTRTVLLKKKKPIRKKNCKADGDCCQQIPGQNPGGSGCDRGNKVGIGE
jgi:hypothetical protein